MVRDADGAIHVVENVCAHRGMRFCRERHGNRKEFVCPYHQWSYTLKGDLQGVPFRRGVKQDGKVQRRHAGRLQDRRPRPDEAEGGHARRRGLRVLRPRGRVARGLPGPDHPRLLRPPVQRPQAEDPGLQPPAHPGQLEADAGEHQGPVPPGPAAHLVRHLRALARRQQVAAAHGRPAPPRGDDLHARRGRQGRAGDAGVQLQGEHAAQRCRASSTSCPSPGGAARPR